MTSVTLVNNEANNILDFYQKYDEDGRMSRRPLEFARCKEIITRYLSKDKMTILDIGGGTGAFSFWLSEQGHAVSLLDFVPEHIETVHRHEEEKGLRLEASVIGDACCLPFGDNCFDLILLMGPLYHLTQRQDRLKALREAYRVTSPGGTIICETISRFSSLIDGFFLDFIKDPEFAPIMKEDLISGLHRDTSSGRNYFTDAYFHHPDDVPGEIAAAGFRFEKLIAVTSFGSMIPDIETKMKKLDFSKLLLETIKDVECEKSLMGISSHFIGIGKKL